MVDVKFVVLMVKVLTMSCLIVLLRDKSGLCLTILHLRMVWKNRNLLFFEGKSCNARQSVMKIQDAVDE